MASTAASGPANRPRSTPVDVEQALEGLELTGPGEVPPGPGEERPRPLAITCCDGMLDGRLDRPEVRVPRGCPTMKLQFELRRLAGQVRAEQLGEQSMEAEPGSTVVERNDEEVGLFELDESRCGSGHPGDRIAERSIHAAEDRRSQQERPVIRRKALHDLGAQVVHDVVARARELGNESGTFGPIGSPLKREGCEVQAGRPPFGPCLERLDGFAIQVETERPVQEPVGLADIEPELIGPDLGQCTRRPEPAQWA